MSEHSPAVAASELAGAIVRFLRENPSFGHDMLSACASGMREAVERANDRAGQYSSAMLCALTLADNKRISPAMRQNFYGIIARAVESKGMSEIERRFAELAKDFSK